MTLFTQTAVRQPNPESSVAWPFIPNKSSSIFVILFSLGWALAANKSS